MSALLASLIPTAYAVATVTVATGLACLASRRVRRVCVALTRFARRYCPRWLLPILAICLAIPGPLDEAAVVAIALVPILRSRRNRVTFGRYMRTAWR
jgi:ABC-type nitrate/sulfonate/bicarbonate transport system permease component